MVIDKGTQNRVQDRGQLFWQNTKDDGYPFGLTAAVVAVMMIGFVLGDGNHTALARRRQIGLDMADDAAQRRYFSGDFF